jgi:hypothetical protein
MTTSNPLQVIKEFLSTDKSRFVSVVYTAKGTGEKARHLLHLNVHYGRVVARDLNVLNATITETPLEAQAKTELIDSLKSTLEGYNPNYTKHGYYEQLVPNRPVFFHQNTLYIKGFSVDKKVIEAGVYKEVKSAPLTLAKNRLRKLLKVNKFREFILDLDRIETVKINGKVLEIS